MGLFCQPIKTLLFGMAVGRLRLVRFRVVTCIGILFTTLAYPVRQEKRRVWVMLSRFVTLHQLK